MTNNQMRCEIAALYPHMKVKTMSDMQVLAIYRSLQKRKKVI